MKKSNIIQFDQSDKLRETPSKFMKSILVDQAAQVIKDPQVLVNIVSQRVKQLNEGRAPLVETLPSMGSADIALTEIIEGKIKLSETPSSEDFD